MSLSNITVLSTFTDKAPVSPSYMNGKWAEVEANFRTLASSISTAVTKASLGWYNVKEYGATGDGTTDDTAAIRLAITAACVAGGTVYFPTGAGERYSITSDLRVTSTHPVHLVMERDNTGYDKSATAAGLVISSDISYPIYYTYPSARGSAGAGSIRGMTIWSTPFRGWDVTAAIYAKDMASGLIEDVSIKGVRGGGILTEMFVQATINRPHILYSGTTDRPPIKLGEGVSNTWVTQSAQVLDGRFEVNSGTTYIVLTTPQTIGGNQGSNTIAFCQFESDSNASTEWPYIDCDQHKCRIQNMGFNRNKHTPLRIGANAYGAIVTDVGSDGDTSANTVRYQFDAQNINVKGVYSRAAVSGTSAQMFVTGTLGLYSNINLSRGGNLRITGQHNLFSVLMLQDLDSTRAAAVEVASNTVLLNTFVWNTNPSALTSVSTAGASTWRYDNVMAYNTADQPTSSFLAFRDTFTPLLMGYGTQAAPSYAFASDRSVGFYRSGVSTIAVSTGTFNLATNAVRFSTRTLAASALTTSAANTNVAVNEMVFTVGGASGASLAIHSGGTVYIFNSAISARAT